MRIGPSSAQKHLPKWQLQPVSTYKAGVTEMRQNRMNSTCIFMVVRMLGCVLFRVENLTGS